MQFVKPNGGGGGGGGGNHRTLLVVVSLGEGATCTRCVAYYLTFFLSTAISAAALLISLVGAAFGISSLIGKGNEGWQAFF